MIHWSLSSQSTPPNVGVFFVTKKNGKIRIIFDTRIANCFFKAPPKTRLPTAAAWSAVEAPASGAFVATADLECAFYHMKLPSGMEEYFSLPAIDSTFLLEAGLADLPFGPGVMVAARVLVLPMGSVVASFAGMSAAWYMFIFCSKTVFSWVCSSTSMSSGSGKLQRLSRVKRL